MKRILCVDCTITFDTLCESATSHWVDLGVSRAQQLAAVMTVEQEMQEKAS